ncbi:MAG: hypothetical protein AB1472_00895 [Candidatus Omnitrophota bacterium]
MRYVFACFLAIIGIIIIIWGHRPVKVKEGRIIKGIDFLTNYGGHLKWLVFLQNTLLKIVLGCVFIFFAILIFLGKM